MTERERYGSGNWWRGAALAGCTVLVGLGVAGGYAWRASSGPASTPAKATFRGHNFPTGYIEMSHATGLACRPPVPPGPAHPDPVLEQVFNVRSSDKASYLLGWDIVPYRGIGTYRFGTDGDVLALEPPAGGRPVGYGTGTITFIGRSSSGTVRALVKLKAGGALDIRGTWVCPATAG